MSYAFSHVANLLKSSWSISLVFWYSNILIMGTVICKKADCGVYVIWQVIDKYQEEDGP